jgi:DNA-binding MarR family transcriptional regulator
MVIDGSTEGEAALHIEQLAAQLHRVVCKMRFGLDRRDSTTRLTTGDLTSPQLSMMFALSRYGPMRMRDLAAHERVYTPTASLMVDRLEQRGLVKRFGTLSDLRAVFVELTWRGHTHLEAVRAARASVYGTRDQLDVGPSQRDGDAYQHSSRLGAHVTDRLGHLHRPSSSSSITSVSTPTAA